MTKKYFERFLSIFLTCLLMFSTIPISANAAEENMALEFEYTVLDDGTIEVDFYVGDKVNVTVPENIDGYEVSSIGRLCFFYNKKIETINIPSTVKRINKQNYEGDVFAKNGLLSAINVDEKNTIFSSEQGVLYNKDRSRIMAYPMNKPELEFIVPNTVKEIGTMAFYYNNNLKKISFSGNLNSIEYAAFNYLKSLNQIDYPIYNVDNTMEFLGYCKEHVHVYISKDVKQIGDKDFIGSDVTLHVYKDSYALEWAEKHEFEYVVIEEEPTTVPETTVPETTVPEITVPETTIPETTVPETTIPETTIPETTVPETTVPETTVPETTVPETTVPETTVPETTVPETTVPEITVPETTVPEITVPETTVPEITVPETTVPETTVPETTVPETTVLEATVPNEQSNTTSGSNVSNGAVATGDVIDNSKLIAIMLAATTAFVLAVRRKKISK